MTPREKAEAIANRTFDSSTYPPRGNPNWKPLVDAITVALEPNEALRKALMWAYDLLSVDGGLSAKEQKHTFDELGKVLRGESSVASSYTPNEWDDSAKISGPALPADTVFNADGFDVGFYQETLRLLLSGNDKIVNAALSNNLNTIISALRIAVASFGEEKPGWSDAIQAAAEIAKREWKAFSTSGEAATDPKEKAMFVSCFTVAFSIEKAIRALSPVPSGYRMVPEEVIPIGEPEVRNVSAKEIYKFEKEKIIEAITGVANEFHAGHSVQVAFGRLAQVLDIVAECSAASAAPPVEGA